MVVRTPHAFLGAAGWILGYSLWEHVANIREHVVVHGWIYRGVRWLDPEQGAAANANQILVASALISS
jgi:hypothetical protein